MTAARLQQQALYSAAHLVAAIGDRRFGSGRISNELKDSLEILRAELDELGLLNEYKQPDGSLCAWNPEHETCGSDVLGRASAKHEKPTELSNLPGHRVVLPL